MKSWTRLELFGIRQDSPPLCSCRLTKSDIKLAKVLQVYRQRVLVQRKEVDELVLEAKALWSPRERVGRMTSQPRCCLSRLNLCDASCVSTSLSGNFTKSHSSIL